MDNYYDKYINNKKLKLLKVLIKDHIDVIKPLSEQIQNIIGVDLDGLSMEDGMKIIKKINDIIEKPFQLLPLHGAQSMPIQFIAQHIEQVFNNQDNNYFKLQEVFPITKKHYKNKNVNEEHVDVVKPKKKFKIFEGNLPIHNVLFKRRFETTLFL